MCCYGTMQLTSVTPVSWSNFDTCRTPADRWHAPYCRHGKVTEAEVNWEHCPGGAMHVLCIHLRMPVRTHASTHTDTHTNSRTHADTHTRMHTRTAVTGIQLQRAVCGAVCRESFCRELNQLLRVRDAGRRVSKQRSGAACLRSPQPVAGPHGHTPTRRGASEEEQGGKKKRLSRKWEKACPKRRTL